MEYTTYPYRIEHRDDDLTWYLGTFRSIRAGVDALAVAGRHLAEKDEHGYVVLIDQIERLDREVKRCDLPVWQVES